MRLLARNPVDFDPARPWIEKDRATREDNRVFRQIVARRASPHTGREHNYFKLEGPDWVNVVALTPLAAGGELLVVEQFRHGIDAATFEIPGGACDPGEDPLQSAMRELLEETGYTAQRWTELGSGYSSPGLTDETFTPCGTRSRDNPATGRKTRNPNYPPRTVR